MDTVGEKIKTI